MGGHVRLEAATVRIYLGLSFFKMAVLGASDHLNPLRFSHGYFLSSLPHNLALTFTTGKGKYCILTTANVLPHSTSLIENQTFEMESKQ